MSEDPRLIEIRFDASFGNLYLRFYVTDTSAEEIPLFAAKCMEDLIRKAKAGNVIDPWPTQFKV